MHGDDNQIVYGNAHLSQCSCGERVRSTPGDIEAHMYPITVEEWAVIDGKADQ